MTAVRALVLEAGAAALRPVAGAPRLSAAQCSPVRDVQILDEHGGRRTIHIPDERALMLEVDGTPLVPLMTIGGAPEWLVLGYLLNQRLIGAVTELESVTVDWSRSVAAVALRARQGLVRARIEHRLQTTGSGQGTMLEEILRQAGTVPMPPVAQARIGSATLLALLETVRAHQAIHHAAGSVHSCALLRGAQLLLSVEDVGRHNAVDTIGGWMALHGVSGADKTLFTTGRLTSEMVLKAALSGVPILVSRNGVSSMGYDLAIQFGMTLFGRAANRRFICYAGAERFDPAPAG